MLYIFLLGWNHEQRGEGRELIDGLQVSLADEKRG